ncbi:putative membrane protein [Serratia plymuthica A30]|nr:putative membrane protein [Serratia plymuthica A30]
MTTIFLFKRKRLINFITYIFKNVISCTIMKLFWQVKLKALSP